MPAPRFLPDARCEVDGLRFRYGTSVLPSTPTEAFLCKDRALIDAYATILPPLRPRRAVEFGILQGGSALFLTALLGLERLVCIDIAPPQPGFEAFLDAQGLRGRIRPYWGVSQDDAPRVRSILADNFADAPPDLILDDASHQLGPSRRSFETVFPMLRKGGCYVLEDWSWAHWPETQSGRWSDSIPPDAPALSNLVFELTMLLGSTGLIARMEIQHGFVLAEKSHRDIEAPVFSLDALIRSRGRRWQPI